MNTEFWIAVLSLLLIAFFFVVPALWRKTENSDVWVERDNIGIAKQKLAELKAALLAQDITQESFEQQRQELELTLDNDLALQQNEQDFAHRQGRWAIYLLAGMLPLVSVSLYFTLGQPDALQHAVKASPVQANPHNKPINSVEGMLAGLEARLQQQPDDVQGWLLLGKSYKHLQQTDKAKQAILKAYQLAENDPHVMLQYADVLLTERQGQFDEQSRKLVLGALQLKPDDTMAMWLAGMLKAQDNDKSAALEYFQQVEKKLPVDSESYRTLQMMMAQLASPAENIAQATPSQRQQWIDQGREYKAQKQYQQAVAAFAKADLLNSQQPDDMLMYADALLMHLQGQFSDKAKQLIFKALKLAPDNTTGLWLAGKAKVQSGEYIQALDYLHKAKANLQADSESYQVLQRYIENVTLRAASQPAVQTLSASPAESPSKHMDVTAKGIQVRVQLDAALHALVQPQYTVFIYARALSGPQMPLAIVRKQVKDLPLQIHLSDAQAMTPMMKLSNFEQVKVAARISRSGNAMRQTGDLLGETSPVTVNSAELVNITINQRID